MTRANTPAPIDFAVADLGLAEFGRKEIRLAEHEMPGLMALRPEYAQARHREGASGVPVFAWKGETLEEYWRCTERLFTFTDEAGNVIGPNMILDNGGDATLLVHKGVEFEQTGVVPTVDDASTELRRGRPGRHHRHHHR